jgi:Flp pilus assembly pilin Flp
VIPGRPVLQRTSQRRDLKLFKKVVGSVLAMRSRVQGSVSSERGATIIEYVLLSAVIAVGVFAVFGSLRNALMVKINSIITTITNS